MEIDFLADMIEVVFVCDGGALFAIVGVYTRLLVHWINSRRSKPAMRCLIAA